MPDTLDMDAFALPNEGLEPCQWAPARTATGARLVWATALTNAVEELTGRAVAATSIRNRALLALEAAEWFRSPHNMVGSFLWVCQHLGLDPDGIRAQLPPIPAHVYAMLRSPPTKRPEMACNGPNRTDGPRAAPGP